MPSKKRLLATKQTWWSRMEALAERHIHSLKTFKAHDGFGYNLTLKGYGCSNETRNQRCLVTDDGWRGGLQFNLPDKELKTFFAEMAALTQRHPITKYREEADAWSSELYEWIERLVHYRLELNHIRAKTPHQSITYRLSSFDKGEFEVVKMRYGKQYSMQCASDHKSVVRRIFREAWDKGVLVEYMINVTPNARILADQFFKEQNAAYLSR